MAHQTSEVCTTIDVSEREGGGSNLALLAGVGGLALLLLATGLND